MSRSQTIAEVRKEWLEVLRQADARGAPWKSSRFATYVGILDELVALEERRKTDPNAYAPFRADLRKQGILFEGGSQLFQLQLASAVWDRFDKKILADKLRVIMAGSDLPSEQETSEPRDTLVELLAAAMGANFGFEPVITANQEDLRARLSGHPDVFVECKRPISRDSLPTALGKVRSQAWKRHTQSGAQTCLAVIAVERVLGLGPLSKVGTPDDLMAHLERWLETDMTPEVRRLCAPEGRGLAPLTPVGIFVATGAVLTKEPTLAYPFVTHLPFDVRNPDDTPGWLHAQLQHSTGLLDRFLD